MRKKTGIYLAALGAALVLAGCQRNQEQPPLERIEYSNLVEPSVQKELAKLLETAEISPERQRVFFDHVNQFNQAVEGEWLAAGFEEAGLLENGYDPYEMQEQWTKKYPDFLGYNCRITAFSLFGDWVEISPQGPSRPDILALDMAALEEDASAMPQEGDLRRFKILYSTIPTGDTQDVALHVKAVQKDWKDRGIEFKKQDRVKLITVFFHDTWAEGSELYIGHTGLLFPVSENEFYFLEKLSFQEPYQFIRFKNRTQLNDYLMNKYDISQGQTTAAPFIMENDRLLEGYRRLQK